MMTKQSSQLKMLFKKIAIIPMAIALLFVFANRVEAKEIEVNSVNKSEIIYQEKVTPKMILEYNALAKKYNSNPETIFKKEEVERLKYIYSLMSEKQKETAESFPNIPPPPPPVKISSDSKNYPPPPPPKKEVENKSNGTINNPYIDSNGKKTVIGHQIGSSSISENDVRHPSILNYTAYAEKFLELQTPSESDLKKLDKLYNDIPQSENTSLMTPDYILNNKDLLKKIIKDSKNKK